MSKGIWLGNHDDLAKLQTHITKIQYDQEEFNKLEPLERRRLVLDQGKPSKSLPRAVSVVTQGTEISSIATTVTGMASTVSNLVKLSNANARAVAEMTQAFKAATD